ncbi:phosphoglycerate kinase [Anaeramoeba flamelloides]|uniref:Phosphoglycerate kinase n=1 Tax=Anaeramoeba flamelloides TaxID=1746091 RepID=A0AAV7YM84_9EUKA|nr:phosphoglycerate kinase [Anaeramoeba flamelloides]KAJ6254122.1 phosphoglycerate kinase [Anaeramoeba flamelloides]
MTLRNPKLLQRSFSTFPNRSFLVEPALYNVTSQNHFERKETKIASLDNKLTITDLNLKDKRVLVRNDFNVPLTKTGEIADATRIESTIKTINYILEQGPQSLVLMSHLGRPNGLVDKKLSLKVVASKLQDILQRPVEFLPDCVGGEVELICQNPKKGSIYVLENLRFHPEETGKGKDKDGNKIKPSKSDVEKFRKSLTKLGDVFINDAFGTSHRAHSSMVGVDLPVKAAGFLLKKEIQAFQKILTNPERPYLAILGGRKVSDKILLIQKLLSQVDEMIICGAMAFTFSRFIHGIDVADSICEYDQEELVKEIVRSADELGVKLHFPIDHLCADKFDPNANICLVENPNNFPKGYLSLDCGPKTSEIYGNAILNAKTVVMNGMPGVFEMPRFAVGTKKLISAIVESKKRGASTIVCGGDSSASAHKFARPEQFTHISTGGGASIELLEGKVLPGIKALTDK